MLSRRKTLLVGFAIACVVFFGAILFLSEWNSRRYKVEHARACISNLMQIDGAKLQWAIETSQPTNAAPSREQVALYILGGFPKCSSGGTYEIKAINVNPTCTITNHVLR
ncbi:MAG: hypothetical protein JWM68_2179 [Verrucomicrobiales bacterium]|nr:hypothetical protein [Verrucomicrobiales bacterium]